MRLLKSICIDKENFDSRQTENTLTNHPLQPALELNNVVFGYSGQQPLLNKLSLSMGTRERIAVLGCSGIGKSSLLRVIAGLERPSQGQISIHGTLVCGTQFHQPPEKRKVGMVFQDWAVFPHLTVFENIAFGLPERGRSPQEIERVEHLLQAFELEAFSRRAPSTLSGGQLQRVACARAMAPRPKILLMDEAFSSLDVHLRQRIREQVLRALEQEGTPSLLVTHDPIEGTEFAHRVFKLEQGQLLPV
jgi:iron(III) transport system ATP-binding protein